MEENKTEFEGLISVSMLSALRSITESDCATEQGIRTQIRQLEAKEKTPEDVGFEILRPTKTVVLLRLVDKKMEAFRVKLMDWVEKNKPK